MAILGSDNDSVLCLFSNPALSSVDTNTFGVGYCAADLLQKMLGKDKCSSSDRAHLLIEPLGVESRDSTAVYPIDPPWLAEALVFVRSNVAKGLIASDVAAQVGKSYVLGRSRVTTDRLTSDRVRGDSVMLDPSARRLRVRLPVEKS